MPRTIFFLLALMLFAAPSAFAQFETASLVGSITDGSGAVIGGATVTLTNSETGVTQTKTTGGNGNFEFITVRIGTYVVTAEKQGFAVALADDIRQTVGARQRVDLTLQVGQITQTYDARQVQLGVKANF